jgi:iron complex outermembrane receptor protein
METNMTVWQISLATTASIIALASPALGQVAQPEAAAIDAGGEEEAAEEIIVTATRRSEPLQRVPIAVSVVTGDRLREAGLNNVRDLATEVPSLNFRTAASNKDQAIFVRGLGTVSTSPGVEPSVSSVLDGVVLARQGQATLDLLDIERVEVLRGPQGTLFGKNASAGVLNIVTRKPGNQIRAFVDASAFEGGEGRVRAGLSGPLVQDRVALGVTAMAAHFDGNVRNLFDGRTVNGNDLIGVRSRLRLTPNDSVELLLTADYSWSRATTPQGVVTRTFLTAFPTGAVTNFPAFASALAPVVASRDNREINSNYPTSVEDENFGFSAELNVALGDHDLTSVTAWRGWNNRQSQDQDRLPGPIVGVAQLHDLGRLSFRQWSQEVRLASPKDQTIDYVLGLFWFEGRNRETYFRETTAVTATTRTVTTGVADYGVINRNFALFGEAGVRLGERLRAFGGLRWVRDELSYDFARDSSSATPVPGIQTDFVAEGRTVSRDVAGRFGIEANVSEGALVYGSYSRGYKGPAFNPAFSMLPQDTNPLAPETSDAAEVGLKSRMFDNALTLNIALFLQKLQSYQVPFFDTFNGSPVTRLVNAGRVSTRGVEVDAVLRPAEHLSISGAAAYTDARIDSFTCPPGTTAACNVNGFPLPFAPKWRLNGRIDWRPPLNDRWNAIIGTDINWRTDTQYSINQTQDTIEPGFAIWNANLGAGTNDGLRVTLMIRNITDRSYAPSLFRFGQGVVRFVPRDDRRYVGINLLKDF